MKISWTYSKKSLRASMVSTHERSKYRRSDYEMHVGGLDRTPIFTHCICEDGRLFTLDYCPGQELHIALIGGVNSDYRFANTATTDQLQTLSNIVRFYLSLGEKVEAGDLMYFEFNKWIKAISKK